MEDFTTAESVTRFLRAKNSTPETVVATARRLLAGQYSLYLPNSAIFVFDLVCDRVSEFVAKNFKQWKFCPELWLLWAEVWHILGSEPLSREIRAKSFRRVKTVSVAVAVLDEVASQIGKDGKLSETSSSLLSNMFACLQMFSTSGYIDVDEFSAIGLVKSYSFMLLQLGSSSDLPIDEWTMLVNSIYELPHQAVTYKPTKKSMARYFTEVLPIHLVLLGSRKNILSAESHKVLHAIFREILFTLERNVLPVQIASAMANPPDFLDESGVSFLFQEVITNMASTDISACETIFLKLTAGKFASMSEELITVLSKVNKTLSSGFFAEIYTKETSQQKPNWTLVSRLLQLDPELTLAKWKDVLDGCSKEPLSKIIIIADNVSSGFVKARDFPIFASEVYPYGLSVSKHWATKEVLAKLTPKVNELSGNQIARLCKQFLDTKSIKPLSLLVQGLLFCPLSKQKTAQSVFTEYSFCHAGWPEIGYYVLCVYGEAAFSTQPEIVARIMGDKMPVQKSDFDLFFRVAELTGDVTHITPKHVISHIKSMSKDSLIPFMERWVVLMEHVPGAYAAWFEKAFQTLSAPEILDYVHTRQALLCEMPAFLTELSESLRKLQPAVIYDLLSSFPPMIFRRFFGDFLTQLTTDALAHPEKADIRKALRHALQEPVLKSPLEKDLSILRELIAKSNSDTRADTLAVAGSIWSAHVTNIKTPQSEAFVKNAIKTFRKSLKKPQEADLIMSRVILSMKSAEKLDDFDKFLERYISVVCDRMTIDNLERQLAALSEIPNLSEKAKACIRETVRKYGTESVSARCQAQLFTLVTKTSDSADAQYVVALFVALHQKNGDNKEIREALLSSIKAYFSCLDNDDYTDLFAHAVISLRDSPADYVAPLIDVCSVLAWNVDKEYTEAHTKLLVAFISAISERSADLENAATVLLFVETLTKLVAEKTWVIQQYSVELALSTAHMLAHEIDYGADSEKVYLAVVKLVSYVVLFRRYRLLSRHHLVLKVFSDLMLPISDTGTLRGSSAGAAAYARLLTNLCEPQIHGPAKDADALTSRAAFFKSALRKHAHILLVNYIHTRLNNRFSGDVSDSMMPGIYSLFSLLSKDELSLVNKCLDESGKAYYQSLYSTYKNHGKWTE
ncbi:hypothetical protein OY671_004795 [Metschnikowia pulcherrima]|nr:hypothetical protein OY671_004795 [Metschnikowia pulcherrima]